MSTPPAILGWPAARRYVFYRSTMFILAVISGCGAPGEPVQPSPPVAAPITDLAAHQAGDGVQLNFTLPTRSLAGDRLVSAPAVEILRGVPKPDGSPDLKSLRVVDTVPGSLTDKYFVEEKFQFLDPIAPAETNAHPGAITIYAVRTRLSPKRTSPNSNLVSLQVFNAPQPVATIETKVTEPAVELSWSSVDHTSAGAPLSAVTYNIYRAEFADPNGAAVSPTKDQGLTHDAVHLKLDSKLQLLASQPDHTYSDKSFEFGKTYVYVVRSVTPAGGGNLESSDCPPVIVTPRDIFPPAVPRDISSAVLPGEKPDTLVVELSWSINVEPDFAGYRVYRSDQPEASGALLTPDLLLTPAYRDTSVQPPHRYWYTVTAVDRAGNESAPSVATSVEVAQPSP